MGKVILAVGATASAVLAFLLWRAMSRLEFPSAGRSVKIMNSTGEPGALQMVGDWEDRDEARHLIEMAPEGAWQFMREGDELHIRLRAFEIPVVRKGFTRIQWEIGRGPETHHFNDPPAWRFWGAFALTAGAPALLAALVAGVVALVSRNRDKTWAKSS
jgi:hypothetical protein